MTIEQRARRACAVLGWDFRGDVPSDRYYVTRCARGTTFVLHDRGGDETSATVEALELAAVLRDAGDVDIGGRTVSVSTAAVMAHDGPSLWRIEALLRGETALAGSAEVEVMLQFQSDFGACDHCSGTRTVVRDVGDRRFTVLCQHCNGLGRVRGDA